LQSFIYPTAALLHVAIGAVCGLFVVGAILFSEPELTSLLITTVKKRFRKIDKNE